MTASTSSYTVGRGKPPLHTQFRKGQSGNPSGKPGPAKLAKQRFQRALYAALEGSTAELELSKPGTALVGMARRMVLDAATGRIPAVRLVLSLLDAESGREASAEDDFAEQLFTGADVLSLLQGKKQGNGKAWLEDILWPAEGEQPAAPDDDNRRQGADEPALAVSAPRRNEAEPLSLVQGKKQGSEKKLSGIIFSPAGADVTPAAKRARLLMSTAAVPQRNNISFGTAARA